MGRYIPNTEAEQKQMLAEIGFNSFDEMFAHLPNEVKFEGELKLPKGASELEVIRTMQKIADKNVIFPTIFRGAGAYRHFIPSIVKSVISKETLMTAYTPYQAETSQGVLQAIYEYQSMICDITGMDVSNASIYDGASASAEAVSMCRERKRHKAFISAAAHPAVISTIETYCHGNGMEVEIIPEKDGLTDMEYLKAHLDESAACVLIQHPNYYGNLECAQEIGEIAHAKGAKYIMNVNPTSLGIIKSPREYGADVACGDGQPLGLSLAFGGPYVGFMACVDNMTRRLPGRIVGKTSDGKGRTGYVLTLQAREQHIRREKASSNVCSNQALCATTVCVYLAAIGKEGFIDISKQCSSKAHYMAKQLENAGLKLKYNAEFYHEFVTVSDKSSDKVLKALEDKGILGGYPLDDKSILWCCTELNSKEDIDEAVKIIKEVK